LKVGISLASGPAADAHLDEVLDVLDGEAGLAPSPPSD
jgi:hypothetical protein